MKNASYRKYNNRTQNSSTYHKKDGTAVRSRLKRDAEDEIKDSGQKTERTEAE